MDYKTLESRILNAHPGVTPVPSAEVSKAYCEGWYHGLLAFHFPLSSLCMAMRFAENEDELDRKYWKPLNRPLPLQEPSDLSASKNDELHETLRNKAICEGFYHGLSTFAYAAPLVLLAAALSYKRLGPIPKAIVDAGISSAVIVQGIDLIMTFHETLFGDRED